MNASEKVAYLKGLSEGLSLDETKPETKLIHAMIDTMELMADDIGALEEQSKYFDEYLDELDKDLGDVENDVYGIDDDDDDDDIFDHYDGDDDDDEDDDDDDCVCDDDCNMCSGCHDADDDQ